MDKIVRFNILGWVTTSWTYSIRDYIHNMMIEKSEVKIRRKLFPISISLTLSISLRRYLSLCLSPSPYLSIYRYLFIFFDHSIIICLHCLSISSFLSICLSISFSFFLFSVMSSLKKEMREIKEIRVTKA